MAKKRSENKKSAIQSEIRHLGVTIERVDHNVGLIAEQYGDIKKDIKGIKETLDSHTEMIGNLSVNIEIVKSDVEFIKQGLKRKVDADEFAALEKRVAFLEKRLAK